MWRRWEKRQGRKGGRKGEVGNGGTLSFPVGTAGQERPIAPRQLRPPSRDAGPGSEMLADATPWLQEPWG